MTDKTEQLKGGYGGKSTRMRERLKVAVPDSTLLTKYLICYTARDLFLGNGVATCSSETLFGNTRPMHIDFGCGRGEYILMMAQNYPEQNFLGIDFHSKSLHVGIHRAADLRLNNVKFIQANAHALARYIPGGSVEKASVLFPAPIVDPKNEKNDVLRLPFVFELHRILGEAKKVLLVSDAAWYVEAKIKLMQELQLFALILIQQAFEDPITRYQHQWQSKGIASTRAELLRVSK